MKIAMLGTGVYSVAITKMLTKNNKNIIMWTESDDLYNQYINDGEVIKDIIPGIELPKFVKLTRSYEKCVKNADIVFIMSTASFVGSICQEIKPFITKNTVICIASKGIENNTCSFLSDIAYSILKNKNIAIVSGPTFAIDLANDNPSALSIASLRKSCIKKIKFALENDMLKLRETNDLIGIQICGSIKNVIALAAGMIAGLGYPESTQCFLITESLHDIKALIAAVGGNPKTILSFAGVGDLLLTCTSTKSRNYSFGYVIGSTKDPGKIENYLKKNTVEGYYTLKSIYKLIKNRKIKMPIIDLIYKIVMDNAEPEELISFLINKK